jgi:hypothetical protein
MAVDQPKSVQDSNQLIDNTFVFIKWDHSIVLVCQRC